MTVSKFGDWIWSVQGSLRNHVRGFVGINGSSQVRSKCGSAIHGCWSECGTIGWSMGLRSVLVAWPSVDLYVGEIPWPQTLTSFQEVTSYRPPLWLTQGINKQLWMSLYTVIMSVWGNPQNLFLPRGPNSFLGECKKANKCLERVSQ